MYVTSLIRYLFNLRYRGGGIGGESSYHRGRVFGIGDDGSLEILCHCTNGADQLTVSKHQQDVSTRAIT